jgi:hypothetical protein
MNATSTVGTVEWTQRTGGRLEPAERRRLVGELARVQVSNVIGRFSVLAPTSILGGARTFRPHECGRPTRH